jgi:shikimate dehydrogenase
VTAHNGKARLVGVIGDPIFHSLSPMIHEYWMGMHQLNAAYVPLHITAEKFKTTLPVLVDVGFIGFNVTLPHKEIAYSIMDTHDVTATLCGAVNTIIVKTDKGLHGMNTDVYGFSALLAPFVKVSKLSRAFVVIGAGGAARAVILAAIQAGYSHIIIANRTLKKATALVERFSARYADVRYEAIGLDTLNEVVSEAIIVVNSISLDAIAAINIEALISNTPQDASCIDISYAQGGTLFTQAADRHNRPYADGSLMLLHQAAPAFGQWFGITPVVDDTLISMMRRVRG